MKITKELVVPNYGLEGTQGTDGLPAIYTTVTNQNIVLNAPYQGLPSDYSQANGSIQVFEGDTDVTQQATYTLKQTLNVAATLDFNKFNVTQVSTDNGMFIVTVKYKEFVSDIMLTTNVVRNGQSGVAGKDGVGVKSTVIRYAINPQGATPPSTGWVYQVPTLIEGQFLWTETTWTYTDNTSKKGYSVAKQGAKGPQGDKGATGQQGPPTGIIESPTIPTEVYQGMLWKNTGNLSGYITDVTYIYRGSKWEKYIFTADNIYADNISAITANLGDVKGGSFTGGKFINNFVDVPLLYNGTSKATGQTKIENGQITIAGKIDNEFNFVNKYAVDAISSTIYYPNSTAVMKAFAITPHGVLLADHQNGFNGQLLASSLTKTPWVTLPLRSGYLVAENNPPQYKINYQLDGTKEVKFRGQFKRDTPMTAGLEYWCIQTPKTIYPPTTIMSFGATNTGNGCRVSITTLGRLAVIIGSTNADYVDISSLNYIID